MSVTSVIDEEEVKSLLDAILKTIQTEADPYLLNQYRALIRKNVSFFKRSYLAAYLLMLRDQSQGRHRKSGNAKPGNDRPGNDRSRGKPNTRNSATSAEPGAEPGAESPRRSQRQSQQNPAPVALPEDEATQLFINIGRSRWVFPREILGLIATKTSVPKEDIGLITILNNYSFVQVRNSSAAEMMDALNGLNFRGKTLAVNYARTRKEGNEKPDDPAPKPDRPAADTPETPESAVSDPEIYGSAGTGGPVDAGYPAEAGSSANPAGYEDTPAETAPSADPSSSENTGAPAEAASSPTPAGYEDTPAEAAPSADPSGSEDTGAPAEAASSPTPAGYEDTPAETAPSPTPAASVYTGAPTDSGGSADSDGSTDTGPG